MPDRNLFEVEVQVDDLTWREQEVLGLLSKRMTNREIADQLHLAESTVKDYVGKILSKLYVKNRREAVERAGELGFLDTESRRKGKDQSNLPKESTQFIGRADELRKIRSVLRDVHLVTLTGPGGIGKTRLAIKIAEEVENEFADGAYFVSLAPISSVDQIVQAIAESIGFPMSTAEQPQAQLLRYLVNKESLLVIDNFEHLLDGANVVSEILRTAPGVKIIATSQENLKLHGETIINIGGMEISNQAASTGTARGDAIALFTQSAKNFYPDYNLSADQIEQITRICKLVEGMPLAVELAASWLHILSEDEIVDELEKDIGILETEARDVPDRHRSIHTVFDHSWSLLSSREQELFMIISVFRGGFTRAAAQVIAGATLRQLAGLVKKSIISYNHASGRYEIHELLRQYAQTRLESVPGASESTQKAHAEFFANLMESNWPRLRSEEQLAALREVEEDIANIRSAWNYQIAHNDAAQIRKFILSYWFVHHVHGWNNAAVKLFGEAVAAISEKTSDTESLSVRALAMGMQGYFMAWLGQSENGYALSSESARILEQLNRPLDLAKVLDGLSLNAYYLSDRENEERAMRTMHEIATKHHDDWFLAYSLFLWSLNDIRSNDYTQASDHGNASLKLFEDIGDEFSTAFPLLALGAIALVDQEYEQAGYYYRKCVEIADKFGYQWLKENASKYLGMISLALNQTDNAEYYFKKSLVIAQETGLGREKANLLYEIANVKENQNKGEQAVKLLSLVLTLPESKLARLEGKKIEEDCLLLLAKLEGELPEEVFSTAARSGQESELDEVISRLIADDL